MSTSSPSLWHSFCDWLDRVCFARSSSVPPTPIPPAPPIPEPPLELSCFAKGVIKDLQDSPLEWARISKTYEVSEHGFGRTVETWVRAGSPLKARLLPRYQTSIVEFQPEQVNAELQWHEKVALGTAFQEFSRARDAALAKSLMASFVSIGCPASPSTPVISPTTSL